MTAGEALKVGLMHGDGFQRRAEECIELRVTTGQRGVDPVEHELGALLRDDQPRLRELGEVARQVGLLDPQYAFELADAEFLAQEQVQYPQTVLVGESFKEEGGMLGHGNFR